MKKELAWKRVMVFCIKIAKANLQIVHKHNRQVIYRPLHDWYARIIGLCVQDLFPYLKNDTIQIIFQVGRSQKQQSLYGLCEFDPSIARFHRIYIYSWKCHIRTNALTLAHEFGHLFHYKAIPYSSNMPVVGCEEFANTYAQNVFIRLGLPL